MSFCESISYERKAGKQILFILNVCNFKAKFTKQFSRKGTCDLDGSIY